MEERGTPAYVAEFLGTFLLVLFITLILSVSSGLGVFDFAVIGLLHAFVLMLLVYALGSASGAHFNPAVTVVITVLRKLRPTDAAIYILLQLAGAVLGALVTRALLTDEGAAINYGAPAVSDLLSGGAFAGFVCEAIGTFALVFSIMAMAVNPRADARWAGWVIGATLGFGIFVFGPLTGGSLNPARAFGPAIVSGDFGPAGTWLLAYVLGPIVGALIAGFSYKAIILDPQAKVGESPVESYREAS